jgi:hypothetical protein
MPEDYDTQQTLVGRVAADASGRYDKILSDLTAAFAAYSEKIEDTKVAFSRMSVEDLASVLLSHPMVLKPILILACVGGSRAIQRDLGFKSIDTYSPKLNTELARRLAAYLLPLLPESATITAIAQLDRTEYVDKEIRASKGRWEKVVLGKLAEVYDIPFKKRRFTYNSEDYEIDAAAPASGNIRVGVDIKRIEATRDLHKRCDEIIGKARALKNAFPGAKVAAIVYYPFNKDDIRSRLAGSDLDKVVFADSNEESIERAAAELLHALPISQR